MVPDSMLKNCISGEWVASGSAMTGDIRPLNNFRSICNFAGAMEKIRALPEVARALKTIGKKHTAHGQQLTENV